MKTAQMTVEGARGEARLCRAGRRVRHQQVAISRGQCESADGPAADHGHGRREAVAENVSEPARDAGNGTGRSLAQAWSVCLDRELAGRGTRALPSGNGRSLPPRGTECGTVPGGTGLI